MALVGSLTLLDAATALAVPAPEGAASRTLRSVSIDSRTIEPGALFVAIAGPRFDGHEFVAEAARRGAAAAMVHRDVDAPLPLLRVADTTRALGDLALRVREAARVPVAAITGSAGKTTTKDMAAGLLAARGPVLKTEGNLNNQYGLPLTLLRLAPPHRFAVLELGMSAAGELRALAAIARPDAAVITLVAPVHLEFFPSLAAIADAKAEILEGLGPGGVAILNGDDEQLRRVGHAHRGPVVWFGRDRAFDVSAERWRGTVHGMRFDLRMDGASVDVALPFAGPHQLTNFLAASAVARHFGLRADEIAARAPSLQPAAHRGQVRRLRGGVTLLDDCYNSNPVAVEAAVAALALSAPGRRVAFLGDMLELGPTAAALHREVGRRVGSKLDALVAVGPLAAWFLEGARQSERPPAELAAFADATGAAEAVSLVRPGDAVLVKGSRGVRLEAVVDELVSRLGEQA
jgi:UDP-N-acetylmuramoyl-tripeptide--D-alanyl-D-alanine ligase